MYNPNKVHDAVIGNQYASDSFKLSSYIYVLFIYCVSRRA